MWELQDPHMLPSYENTYEHLGGLPKISRRDLPRGRSQPWALGKKTTEMGTGIPGSES